jgi:hypothetical protein
MIATTRVTAINPAAFMRQKNRLSDESLAQHIATLQANQAAPGAPEALAALLAEKRRRDTGDRGPRWVRRGPAAGGRR